MMHGDARPWAPFSTGNPFLGVLSFEQLHQVCLVSLAPGSAWIVARRLLRRGVER